MSGDKILLTGMPGFIASHLAPKLVERGYKVYALIRYVTGRQVETPEGVIQVHGDLRDAFTIKQIVSTVMPDIVVNLAAFSPVAFSYDRPKEYMDVNLQGVINLAESCLRSVPHFKQFVQAGTSEEYGNQVLTPIAENVRLYPNSPYAVANAAATKYLEYMRDAYDFPITVSRCFNTYGRTRNRHFVMERIVTQMLEGVDTIRLGDPRPVRDMMFREDHVDAYLRVIGEPHALRETFNFCTGRGLSIAELVEICRESTDYKGEVEWYTVPARPLDIDRLVGDPGKAGRVLGWEAGWSVERGVEWMVDYWHGKLTQ